MSTAGKTFITTINILGLIIIGLLEAIRPGLVSGAVNIGIIWLVVMTSLIFLSD